MNSTFKVILIFLQILMLTALSSAQNLDEHHITMKSKDSLCLKETFLKSNWEAHTRTFLMGTINEGNLKDDYALASGAGIGLLTKSIYGFQAGVSGFFIYNLASSKINLPDSITNVQNRYEVGLFDVENPGNKNDLDRLEELYLKYNYSKSAVTVGKIHINTPFINPQDGRMRPTIAEGVWFNLNESKKIGLNGGWIWDVSPRSTVQWFTVANSIGINPSGVDVFGNKSDYKGNINSKGMAIANIYYNPSDKLKLNFWNGLLDNVMNTAMVELNLNQTIKKKLKFYQGIIFLNQNAIHNGGNVDPRKTYLQKNAKSNVISAQLGLKDKRNNISINYTHITGDGRYLMPREWGKEPFYTFMPRERNEGLGNVHAMMIKSSTVFYKEKVKLGLSFGYFLLPDVKDFRLNKYGMPSYQQLNFDAAYQFDKFLKGLEMRVLIAAKKNEGKTYDNLKYVYNKVNLVNFNFILDFKI